LRQQPYKKYTLRQKRNQKIVPKFYGPYNIICKIGEVDYELDLYFSHIHKVFYVSFQKTFLGQAMLVYTKLLEFDEEGNLILEL
jgi:hypothetical protein